MDIIRFLQHSLSKINKKKDKFVDIKDASQKNAQNKGKLHNKTARLNSKAESYKAFGKFHNVFKSKLNRVLEHDNKSRVLALTSNSFTQAEYNSR